MFFHTWKLIQFNACNIMAFYEDPFCILASWVIAAILLCILFLFIYNSHNTNSCRHLYSTSQILLWCHSYKKEQSYLLAVYNKVWGLRPNANFIGFVIVARFEPGISGFYLILLVTAHCMVIFLVAFLSCNVWKETLLPVTERQLYSLYSFTVLSGPQAALGRNERGWYFS